MSQLLRKEQNKTVELQHGRKKNNSQVSNFTGSYKKRDCIVKRVAWLASFVASS